VEGCAVLQGDGADAGLRENILQLLDHKGVAGDVKVAAETPVERRQEAAVTLAVAVGAEALIRRSILEPDGPQS
jgi:hypothetical protein